MAFLRAVRAFTVTVIGAAWLLNCLYCLREPIWSPRDEIAHYDYIDRLSEGSRPGPHDFVTQYTADLSRSFTWIKPQVFDGTALTMGIAGRSYEAEQPPLYYASLAVLNRLLKGNTSPERQVRLLRLASLFLVVAAVVVLLMAGGYVAERDWPLANSVYFGALLLSLANTSTYSTLGNDALSTLCGAIALWLTVRALDSLHGLRDLALLSAVVTVSVLLVKVSNLLLLVSPLGVALFLFRSDKTKGSSLRVAAALSPLVLIPLYFAYRQLFSESTFGSVAAREYFAGWLSRIPTTSEFVRTLLCDVFNFAHIGVWAPPLVGTSAFFVLLASGVAFLLTQSQWPPRRHAIAVIALTTVVVVLAASSALNRWSPGVHWHAFRHYASSISFLAVALTYPLWRSSRAASSGALLCSSMVGCAVLSRLAQRLF